MITNSSKVDVVTAKDGGEAVKCYKKILKDEDKCIGIFMDICMPIKDGYEATREIREYERVQNISRIKIVGLSASGSEKDNDKEKQICIEAGMDNLIFKPISNELFQCTLSTMTKGIQ